MQQELSLPAPITPIRNTCTQHLRIAPHVFALVAQQVLFDRIKPLKCLRQPDEIA
jgi:hypothetical protein